MNFSEASSYLLSLGNEVSAMKLGLESIGKVLENLGNPQNKYVKVQVAGTNGKGSACAFLDAICHAAGIRTGLYTSPHLASITERIRIDGNDISEEDFARHATIIREISESLAGSGELGPVPTFFEQVTAIALSVFAANDVELAILETGLGGRLDATTAARAEIAAITRIDYDHQKILGESIEEIAAEKAAIIRPDSRVVIGDQPLEAMRILLDRSARFNLTPVTSSEPNDWKLCYTEEGTNVRLETTLAVYDRAKLGLKGRHQVENGRVAVSTAQVLHHDFGFDITDDCLLNGLEHAFHPGRLEYVRGRYLLDGAHNVGGARALAAYLHEFEKGPITMIYGTMRDKDVGAITRILFPAAANLILTKPNNPRALGARGLLRFSSDKNVHVTRTAEESIRLADDIASGLILVTGSLYLVGEARKLLLQK